MRRVVDSLGIPPAEARALSRRLLVSTALLALSLLASAATLGLQFAARR